MTILLSEIYDVTLKRDIRDACKNGFIRPTIGECYMSNRDFEEISSGPTYVGQFYEGGYYMGTLGDYRIICSPIEGETSAVWGPFNVSVPGAISTTDGYQNTLALIADSQDHPAANFCNNLTIGGYTDWYLPAKDELYLIYLAQSALTEAGAGLLSQYYWASTEYNAVFAWLQAITGVQYTQTQKEFSRGIRAIRRILI